MRNALGLTLKSELEAKNPVPHFYITNRGTEAARQGHFGSLKVTLVAVDAGNTYTDKLNIQANHVNHVQSTSTSTSIVMHPEICWSSSITLLIYVTSYNSFSDFNLCF